MPRLRATGSAAKSLPITKAVRQALQDSADPAKAPGMQAYMKSAMPYHGISAPQLRQTLRAVYAQYPLPSFEAWQVAVLDLWRNARYREERYAAIGLAGHRPYRDYRGLDALPLYEEMISSGAWWDYVDSLATRDLGELLRKHPKEMGRILRQWARSDDLWKRRSAILAQLGFKRDTDLALLYDCILPSVGSPEFFLRKAIGWALRQYARTDPKEVIRFVRHHEAKLSPLSKREALKRL